MSRKPKVLLAPVTKARRRSKAAKALAVMHREKATWQAVSDHFAQSGHPLNRGLLCAVANGSRPAPNSVLLALGLPPKTMPAMVCPVHGVVHLAHRCPPDPNAPKRRRVSYYKLYATLEHILPADEADEIARRLKEQGSTMWAAHLFQYAGALRMKGKFRDDSGGGAYG